PRPLWAGSVVPRTSRAPCFSWLVTPPATSAASRSTSTAGSDPRDPTHVNTKEEGHALRGDHLPGQAGPRGRDCPDLRELPARRLTNVRRTRRRTRRPTAGNGSVHQRRRDGPVHPLRGRLLGDRQAPRTAARRAPDRGAARPVSHGTTRHQGRGGIPAVLRGGHDAQPL